MLFSYMQGYSLFKSVAKTSIETATFYLRLSPRHPRGLFLEMEKKETPRRLGLSDDFPAKPKLSDFKKDLMIVLETVDLKGVVKHLVKGRVISNEVSKYFSNFDYDRLEREVVAGFLVNEILRSIKSRRVTVKVLLNKLEKKDSVTENLCAIIRNYLAGSATKKASFTESVMDNSPIEIYTGIGHKRSFPYMTTDILTDKDIPYLTEVLCKSSHKWKELGIALHLPEHELEECRKASNNALRLHRVLSKRLSQDTSTDSTFTLRALKNALESNLVGMKSLAESLEDEYKKLKGQTSKKPRPQSSIVDENNTVKADDGTAILLGLPRSDEAQSYQWKKEAESLHNDSNYFGVCDDVLLIKSARQGMEGEYSCYTNDGRLVAKISLEVIFSPEKRKLLDKYTRLEEIPNTWPPIGTSTFIELALIHNDRHHDSADYDYSVRGDMDDILEKKRKVNYTDIFSSIENGILVLIEGRPGCGKTTLTHKITRDWARGPDILKRAKELFLVSLRILALKSVDSLSGILNIIYHNSKTSQLVADKLEESDGQGACFIIDGLDEYKERDNPDNVIYHLINKEYLSKAMIIVASRPVGTVNVRDRASKQVEVLGFSKNQIKDYLKAYSFKAGNSVSRLEAFLEDHVNVYHMCYLPVHAAMICHIYDYDGEIPSTETKIYECFTLLTIKRMLKKNNDSTKIELLQRLRGSLKTSFDNVCKLAFDMTVSSKQAAYESDIDSHLSDDVGSNIHSLGLVTIDSTARLLDFEHLYSFLHLTFQEFLAAFHLTALDEDTQLMIIREHISKREMIVVWKFYCGLVKFCDSKDQRLEHIMNSMKKDNLYRFQCALESKQNAVCDSAFQNGENTSQGSICVRDHTFLTVDFNALGYSIANTSFHVTELEFSKCILSLEGVQNFTECVGHDKIRNIKSFAFSANDEEEQFKIVNHILKRLKNLETLDLKDAYINEESVNSLSNEVEFLGLKVLKIRMPVIKFHSDSTSDCLKLLSFNSNKLEQVHYSYAETEQESHNTSLMKILKSFQCEVIPLSSISHGLLCNLDIKLKLSRVSKFLYLSILLLVNCNLHDQDFEYLTTTVKLDNVQTLCLDFNKLTCTSAKNLAKSFPLLTKLTHLSISCNLIGNDGAKALAKALPQVRTLTEFDLQGNKIGDEGAIAIAQAVKDFPYIFHLSLSNINITSEGVAKVLENRSSADVEGKGSLMAKKFIITKSPEAVTRAVGCCENLHSLDFSGKHIAIAAALELANTLKNCSNLKSVNLSECSLKYNTLNPLGEGLNKCKNLVSVNFGGNRIEGNEILKLVSPLQFCPDLQDLDIHDNFIRDGGLKSVASELGRKKLRSLNLHNCQIGEYGGAALAECLRLGAVGRQPLKKTELIPGHEKFDNFVLENLNIAKGNNNPLDKLYSHSWCHSLVNLNLGSNDIGSAGAAALSYGLKCCHKLQSLDLSSNIIEADGAAVLAHGLKLCSELKELVLDNNPLKDDGATELIKALKYCSKLEKLSCENIISCSNDTALYRLAYTNSANLSYSERLKESLTDRSEVTSKWTTTLGECMMHWNQLKTFNGSKNNIHGSGLAKLAMGLAKTNKLEHLYLRENKIAAEGMDALAESVKTSHLKELDLENNCISHHGMIALNEGIKKLSSIKRLNISMNLLGSVSTASLGEGLGFCGHLTWLVLSGNNIGPSGVQNLVKGLKCCTDLLVLDLTDNDILSEGATALADILNNFPNLQELSLNKNNIGLEGIKALVGWMKLGNASKSLIELQLGHNNIGSDGACELAEGLRYMKTIQNLNVESNNLGPLGSLELAKGLKFCTNMKILWLDNNGIDHAGALALVESLCDSQLVTIRLEESSSDIHVSELTNILRYCEIEMNGGYYSYQSRKKELFRKKWKNEPRREEDVYEYGHIFDYSDYSDCETDYSDCETDYSG